MEHSIRGSKASAIFADVQIKKKKHKGIIVTEIVLSIVIISELFGSFVISKGKSEVYYDNSETVTYKMLDGAANAETAGNLIKNVW